MHELYIQKKSKTQKGFSLVELLVALSVFAVIMTVSVGTLLTLININAKAQALHTATTNLSFSLDSMTREIRMGYHYHCFTTTGATLEALPAWTEAGASVGAGGAYDCSDKTAITFFREKDSKQVGYRYNAAKEAIEQKIENSAWEEITSTVEIKITNFLISVENSEPYYPDEQDEDQPYVDILVSGYVHNGLETDTDFSIQSHIIQRRLDLI